MRPASYAGRPRSAAPSTCNVAPPLLRLQENKALQTKAVVLNRHSSFRRSAAEMAQGLTVRLRVPGGPAALGFGGCCGQGEVHAEGGAARAPTSLLCLRFPSLSPPQSLAASPSTDWSEAASQQCVLDAAKKGLPGPEALEQLRGMSLEQAVQFYKK